MQCVFLAITFIVLAYTNTLIVIQQEDEQRKIHRELTVKHIPSAQTFSDETISSTNNKFFEGMSLVVLPRHLNLDIEFTLKMAADVFRFVCDGNSNEFYSDWRYTDIEITLPRCLHRKVVSRKFDAGVYIFPPGGPASSDPIFVDAQKEHVIARTLLPK